MVSESRLRAHPDARWQVLLACSALDIASKMLTVWAMQIFVREASQTQTSLDMAHRFTVKLRSIIVLAALQSALPMLVSLSLSADGTWELDNGYDRDVFKSNGKVL